MRSHGGSVKETMQRLADEIGSLNSKLDQYQCQLAAQRVAITMLGGALKGHNGDAFDDYRHLMEAMMDFHRSKEYVTDIDASEERLASLRENGNAIAVEIESLLRMLDEQKPLTLQVEGGNDDA